MNALEGFLELVRTYPGAFAYLAGILTLCALAFTTAIIGIRKWLDNRQDADDFRVMFTIGRDDVESFRLRDALLVKQARRGGA